MTEQNVERKFSYQNVQLSQLEVEILPSAQISKADRTMLRTANGGIALHGGNMIKSILVDGERITPSNRFWESLFAKFGLNRSFFRYFSPNEVFKRIGEKNSGDTIRLCIEESEGNKTLLGATGANRPIIIYDDLCELLQEFDQNSVLKYSNGIVSTTHAPRSGATQFDIGPDKFSNRFEVYCPVDGYGAPNIYLSLLRWVCSNGAVGFAKAFQTSLNIGSGQDSIQHALRRAFESFSNDEGYALMRDRFLAAQQSQGSVREYNELYKLLLGLQSDTKLRESLAGPDMGSNMDSKMGASYHLMNKLHSITGNPFETYKTDPNSMTEKRSRALPVEGTVYEMINFATELATHKLEEHNSRQLQAWVGKMISQPEFDLEGSVDQFNEFRALYLKGNS